MSYAHSIYMIYILGVITGLLIALLLKRNEEKIFHIQEQLEQKGKGKFVIVNPNEQREKEEKVANMINEL
jgi:cell division protein ZapA (FtsZ GTPase activity inhibitor)